jgi:hypothetical protein
VTESKVLRRIFVSKRDEVAGGWRSLIRGSIIIYY